MAVTFVGVTTLNDQNNSGSASQNIAVPTGVADGDLLLLVEMSEDTGLTRAGWTSLFTEANLGGTRKVRAFWRAAVAGDVGATLSLGTMTRPIVSLYAYRGASAATAAVNGGQTLTSTSAGATVAGVAVTVPPTTGAMLLDAWFSVATTSGGATNRVWTTPSGLTRRNAVEGSQAGQYLAADRTATAGSAPAVGAVVDDIGSTNEASSGAGVAIAVYPPNTAPNAPILVGPIGGQDIDRALDLVLDHDFSDPDAGDSQSARETRWRVVGAVSWTTTGEVASTVTAHTIPGGTLAAGEYEWQARTADAAGEWGPFSASGFFTADDKPGAPTITSGVAEGGTIPTDPYTETWSTPIQDSAEWRTVADNAGVPDTATVYQSGTTGAASRSASVPYPVNERWEHFQVRVEDDGLWSDWASRRRYISYTPPAVPTVAVTTDTSLGAIYAAITNPTPGSGEPTVTSHDIYRRETATGGDGIRVAADLAPGATWTDWTPASGTDYEYLAVAFGDNSTSTSSAWTGAATEVEGGIYGSGGY